MPKHEMTSKNIRGIHIKMFRLCAQHFFQKIYATENINKIFSPWWTQTFSLFLRDNATWMELFIDLPQSFIQAIFSLFYFQHLSLNVIKPSEIVCGSSLLMLG